MIFNFYEIKDLLLLITHVLNQNILIFSNLTYPNLKPVQKITTSPKKFLPQRAKDSRVGFSVRPSVISLEKVVCVPTYAVGAYRVYFCKQAVICFLTPVCLRASLDFFACHSIVCLLREVFLPT